MNEQQDIRNIKELLGDEVVSVAYHSQTGVHRSYIVQGEKRKLLARVHGNDDYAASETERDILEHLAARGIPVPHVVAYSTKPLITVFSFVEGEHPEIKTDEDRLYTGRAREAMVWLAKIHQAGTSNIRFSRKLTTEADKALELQDIIISRFSNGKEFIRDIQRSKNLVSSNEDPSTLLHNDYRPTNVLFSPGQNTLTAVLDFEWSCAGPSIKDVAHAILEWTVPDQARVLPEDRMKEMLMSYNEHSPTNIPWDALLLNWMQFGAISDAATYVASQVTTKEPVQGEIRSYMYEKSKLVAALL